MQPFFLAAFVLLAAYAVLGNVFVYAVLVRRGVRLEHGRMHIPGYLAKICRNPSNGCGQGLQRVATSTDIAFWLTMALTLALLVSWLGRSAA